jgi:CRISPR-associated protein Cas2
MADPVWLLLMFDLPVLTKEHRRRATQYRKMILDLGFSQVQLSVYSKYLVNASGVRSLLSPIRDLVPPQGDVRMLKLTDEQWASTYRYFGAQQVPIEGKPEQLGLFISPTDRFEISF